MPPNGDHAPPKDAEALAVDGIAIDLPLVRTLVREQHRDLADRPLHLVANGWDNAIFRLGEDLAVRLPRRAVAEALIVHEQRWLPRLAPLLPLPVPAPVRVGRPSALFPAAWSIVPWLDGESALGASFDEPSAAIRVGRFLRALHTPAPSDAPMNRWRGVPLRTRSDALREHVRYLDARFDPRQITDLWDLTASVTPWTGPPLWIHGDLHPGNLLVRDRAITAVIDFGDVTAGDPATDFAIAWMLLSPSARTQLFEAAAGGCYTVDDSLQQRARGWALALGLAIAASPHADAAMQRMGMSTVEAMLASEGGR
jgi:aminoglycoside phosphotransferase (APT) family kinase protein